VMEEVSKRDEGSQREIGDRNNPYEVEHHRSFLATSLSGRHPAQTAPKITRITAEKQTQPNHPASSRSREVWVKSDANSEIPRLPESAILARITPATTMWRGTML
jgi:hypothetical protein